VSNDQSPPARKVIPYKKGGQRKSPFADMAFQFSGTALDVAIQQREEGVVESPPEFSEIPAQSSHEDVTGHPDDSAPETDFPQAVRDKSTESGGPRDETVGQAPQTSTPLAVRSQPRQRRRRDVRLVPERKSETVASEESDSHLRAFITRWQPFLTETQLGICAHVYNNSIVIGRDYCFTSTAKLMAAVSKTERQVKTVLNQLMDWGFIIKGETIVNAPREDRGTYYKLMIDKP
jgi:hypothetical protein